MEDICRGRDSGVTANTHYVHTYLYSRLSINELHTRVSLIPRLPSVHKKLLRVFLWGQRSSLTNLHVRGGEPGDKATKMSLNQIPSIGPGSAALGLVQLANVYTLYIHVYDVYMYIHCTFIR